MPVKANIYCSSCGGQNIVQSPVEGMEIICNHCGKSVILKKKSSTASQRLKAVNDLNLLNTRKTESGRLQNNSVPVQSNLVEANLKMLSKLEELEDKVANLQKENLTLSKQLTQKMVEAKELASKNSGDYQGKELLEAILLEVKDQKAGQELAQALQKKDSETLYKTINALALEIYEIKQELENSQLRKT